MPICVSLVIAPCVREFLFMKPSFDEPPGRMRFSLNDIRNGSVETHFHNTQAGANGVGAEPFKCLSPADLICRCGSAHFFYLQPHPWPAAVFG